MSKVEFFKYILVISILYFYLLYKFQFFNSFNFYLAFVSDAVYWLHIYWRIESLKLYVASLFMFSFVEHKTAL